MQKYYQKLIKLQTKAQECVSRDKAQKIIKKADKQYEKARTVENIKQWQYKSLLFPYRWSYNVR